MSQSVGPRAVNGNRLNLSGQAGVLAYWVKDTLNTGTVRTIDPVTRCVAGVVHHAGRPAMSADPTRPLPEWRQSQPPPEWQQSQPPPEWRQGQRPPEPPTFVTGRRRRKGPRIALITLIVIVV